MKADRRSRGIVFARVLEQAEKQLLLDFGSAANFGHLGTRGDERALALQKFLSEHLPTTFTVGKGEAIDYQDRRTPQLDLCIYDSGGAAPIQESDDHVLLPAEAMYAVIEVKSVLTKYEMEKCASDASSIRKLRPFGKEFVPAQVEGKRSEGTRCQYIVFAYSSDISRDDWAVKEWNRLKSACTAADTKTDVIDRVVVLDRGIMAPREKSARERSDSESLFLDFYVHLINYLMRERRRRAPIDWAIYAPRAKWFPLP